MSKYYDILAASEKKFKEVGIEKLRVRKGEYICEIGCGTGESLLALSQLVGESGNVYGIDISAGMLHITQKKIKNIQFHQNIRAIVGDAVYLPFPSAVFNGLFMAFTLELFDTPEIPRVLQECSRVLLPGGRICVVGLSKRKAGTMVALYEWVHHLFPKYVDCRPIYVEESLENSGFTVVDATLMKMWRLPVEIVLAQNR